MRRESRLSDSLCHGGLGLHRVLGQSLKISFCAQSALMAAVSALVLLLASMLDGTLLLPGRDVGLLEHPAIWTFIGLQAILPTAIGRSIATFLRSRSTLRSLGIRAERDSATSLALRFLRLDTSLSRFTATILYSAGLIAFVWNTYQNQQPGIVLPFDFWDSSNHTFGFWTTRVYKLYLFAWLLPYIALIHAAILCTTLRLIRNARLSGTIELAPFHPDGVGGFGFVSTLVSTPILVSAAMSSVALGATLVVHRAPDVTPLIGFGMIVFAIAISYLIPIAFLRTDIAALKRAALRKIREKQDGYYRGLLTTPSADVESVRLRTEAVDDFEHLAARIQSISNYPHLKRLVGYTGLALAPSLISATYKLYSDFSPIILPLLKIKPP